MPRGAPEWPVPGYDTASLNPFSVTIFMPRNVSYGATMFNVYQRSFMHNGQWGPWNKIVARQPGDYWTDLQLRTLPSRSYQLRLEALNATGYSSPLSAILPFTTPSEDSPRWQLPAYDRSKTTPTSLHVYTPRQPSAVNFTVYYRLRYADRSLSKWRLGGVVEPHHEHINLSKTLPFNTTILIQAKATNKTGSSPFGPPLIASTLPAGGPTWPLNAFDASTAAAKSVIVRVPHVFPTSPKQNVKFHIRPVSDTAIPAGFWQTVVIESTVTQPYVVIRDLKPNTTYEVFIELGNGTSYTPRSASLFVYTIAEGAPMWQQPPVVAERATYTSITFNVPFAQYDASMQPIQYFTFSYRPVMANGSVGSWQEDTTRVQAGTATFVLTGLQANHLYDVHFRGNSATAATPYSSVIRVSTPSLDTPLWPYPAFDAAHSLPTSAVIRRPLTANQPVENFTVSVRYLTPNGMLTPWKNLPEFLIIPSDIKTVRIDGLMSNKTLQIRLSGNSDKGKTPFSLPLQVKTLAQGAPIWPDIIFPLHGVTSNSLLVNLPGRSAFNLYRIFYRSQARNGTMSEWFEVDGVNAQSASYKLTSLFPDLLYEVEVQGYNSTNITPRSATAHQRTLPVGAPVTPQQPVFESISSATGMVKIVLPIPYSSHPAHPVDSFIAEYRPHLAFGEYGPLTQVTSSLNNLFLPLPQLRPDTEYQIFLRAKNQFGTSSRSLPSRITTPRAGAPLQPLAPGFGPGVSSFSFRVVFPDKSSYPALYPVVNYMIEYTALRPNGNTQYVRVSADLLQYVIAGLLSNTSYQVRLQARNEQGNSPWSEPSVIKTLLVGEPMQPVRPQILPGATSDRLRIALPSASDFPHSHPVEKFGISFAAQYPNGSWPVQYQDYTREVRVGIMLAEIVALQPNTSYRIRINTQNRLGVSTWSPFAIGRTINLGEPVQPAAPVITDSQQSFAVLDLTPLRPLNTSSHPIRFVEVSFRPNQTLNGGHLPVVWHTSIISSLQESRFRLAQLKAGTAFLIRWRTANNQGISRWSPTSHFRTWTLEPLKPRQPSFASRKSSSRVTVFMPREVEGDTVNFYQLQYRQTNVNDWNEVAIQIGSGDSYMLGMLLPNTSYEIRVVAFNNHGQSPPSDSAIVRTLPVGAPMVPLAPTVGFHKSSVTITLVFPPLASLLPNHPVVSYRVSYRHQSQPEFRTLADVLAADGVYVYSEGGSRLSGYFEFRLSAINDYGVSDWSPSVTVQPLKVGFPITPGRPIFSEIGVDQFTVSLPEFTRVPPDHPVDAFNISLKSGDQIRIFLNLDFGSSLLAIRNLQPATTYVVCISAIYKENVSPFGPCGQVTTRGRDCTVTVDNAETTVTDGGRRHLFGLLRVGADEYHAADTMLLVDESLSLAIIHQWLPELVTDLESSLQSRGIGTVLPNLYSVVGFASTNGNLNGKGHLIYINGAAQYRADKVANATALLKKDGRLEDGYCAIQYAMDTIQPLRRTFALLHIILITDEDRDNLCQQMTNTLVQSLLTQEKAELVTMVKQRYTDKDERELFGVGHDANGFIYDQTVEHHYSRVRNGRPQRDTAAGTTQADYTNLAMQMNGSSWSVDLLRSFLKRIEEGVVGSEQKAKAFRNALVAYLVERSLERLQSCQQCFCDSGTLSCSYLSLSEQLCKQGKQPKLVADPAEVFVRFGQEATLRCALSADTFPMVNIHWSRANGQPISGRIVNGQLRISRSSKVDVGDYICFAENIFGRAFATIALNVSYPEECIHTLTGKHIPANNVEEVYRLAPNEGLAADLVFMVDQSNSMVQEHRWLANISVLLGEFVPSIALNSEQIKLLARNAKDRFGLVGFAENREETKRGVPIPMSSGKLFGNATEFNKASDLLKLNGFEEDGYHAIRVALESYNFRQQAACNLILVTDEGQTILDPHLSWSFVFEALTRANCTLHVIVKEEFEHDALGITHANDTYIQLPNGRFELRHGVGKAFPSSGNGNTHEAYVELALATRGSAWNIQKLRSEGQTSASFSAAFVNHILNATLDHFCEVCICQLDGHVLCRPCHVEAAKTELSVLTPYINEGASASAFCQIRGGSQPSLTWSYDASCLPDLKYLDCFQVQKTTCVSCSPVDPFPSSTATACFNVLGSCLNQNGEVVLHNSYEHVVSGGVCKRCHCLNGSFTCAETTQIPVATCSQPPDVSGVLFIVTPVSASVQQSQSVSMSCQAFDSAFRKLPVYWSPHPLSAVAFDNGDLTFSYASATDKGTYTCIAMTDHGVAKQSVTLTVVPQSGP